MTFLAGTASKVALAHEDLGVVTCIPTLLLTPAESLLRCHWSGTGPAGASASTMAPKKGGSRCLQQMYVCGNVDDDSHIVTSCCWSMHEGSEPDRLVLAGNAVFPAL